MRWGVTNQWKRWYAWKPVRLIDGRWVWLEWVEVTNYVTNADLHEGHRFNCRIFSPSFAVRIPLND